MQGGLELDIRADRSAREPLPFTLCAVGREGAVPDRLLRLLHGVDVRDQHDVDAGIEALLDAGLSWAPAVRATDRPPRWAMAVTCARTMAASWHECCHSSQTQSTPKAT